jgi:hypothetical protein
MATKIIIDGPGTREQLPDVLEGYLYAIGEICHGVFGSVGEEAMYRGIGKFFLNFLQNKGDLIFATDDPWVRYCTVIEYFTKKGFYSHVELDVLEDGKYRMLETNQYAGTVWEEQGSWRRGTAPCPLWSVVLASLAQADYTIVLEDVTFRDDVNGFESIFLFVKKEEPPVNIIELTKQRLIPTLIPICCGCGRIRDTENRWQELLEYMHTHARASVSHGMCPDCIRTHYPENANEIIDQMHAEVQSEGAPSD